MNLGIEIDDARPEVPGSILLASLHSLRGSHGSVRRFSRGGGFRAAVRGAGRNPLAVRSCVCAGDLGGPDSGGGSGPQKRN